LIRIGRALEFYDSSVSPNNKSFEGIDTGRAGALLFSLVKNR